MVLQYTYHEEKYSLMVDWNDFEGRSTVHTAIVERLTSRHGESFSGYWVMAQELDEKTDKLYECIHAFNNEHYGVPYDSRHRNMFLNAFSSFCESLDASIGSDFSEPAQVLLSLFQRIQYVLQEMVGIYLAEHTYQGKYRYRHKNLETRLETVNQLEIAYEFDSLLTDLLALSHMLEHLTEPQRQRLIQYFLQQKTYQQIADQEGVSVQAVRYSILAALRKLRELL